MDHNPAVPGGVQLLAARLSGDLASLAVGAEVVVTHVKDQRWRVTAANSRITMWIEVEPLPRRRLKWRASEFLIDGIKHDRRVYEDVLKTFADPDGTGEPEPVTEVPLSCAPATVAKLVTGVPKGMFEHRIERSGTRYRVTFENDRIRVVLRVRETFDFLHPAKAQQADIEKGIQLWVDGVDRSETAGKTLSSVFRTALAHMAEPSSAPVRGPAQAAVNTGVQVRKITVIRN
jgi:hypothetical protein